MTHDDCIFCRILNGEADADFLYRDDDLAAFWDARPAAPVHVLIVPTKHIASINDVSEQDEQLLGHMLAVVKSITDQEGVAESGYRLILNNGPDANQVVFHLHLHILGGQRMQHRMG